MKPLSTKAKNDLFLLICAEMAKPPANGKFMSVADGSRVFNAVLSWHQKQRSFSDRIKRGDGNPTLFQGADYNPERDYKRLTAGLKKVWHCMRSGGWWTLKELHEHTGIPEASVSANIRCFRRVEFGEHTVNRRHLRNGLYEYQLIVNPEYEKVINALPVDLPKSRA